MQQIHYSQIPSNGHTLLLLPAASSVRSYPKRVETVSYVDTFPVAPAA